MVINLPANAGDTGSNPGLGGSSEKEMATHCSILAWRVPWTEEPSGLQSMGHKESDTTEGLTLSVTESSAFMQYTGSVIKEIYILIS